MKLWFDQRMRTYVVFEKSLRCHLLRHEKDDGRGCDGAFRQPGFGPSMCACRCHAAAVHRRALTAPPFPIGPTVAEAAENLCAVFALMPKLAATRIGHAAALAALAKETAK